MTKQVINDIQYEYIVNNWDNISFNGFVSWLNFNWDNICLVYNLSPVGYDARVNKSKLIKYALGS